MDSEADHVTRLRKNLNDLKNHLDADHVLDCLHQEGVFSMAEMNQCRVANNTLEEKSKAIVEILMRKGAEDYTVFRIIVQEKQPYITDKLDNTHSEGNRSFINQHIHNLEQKHKDELKAKDERIAKLMKISDDQKEAHEVVEKQRNDLEKTIVERDGQLEEQRQRRGEEIQIETERHRAELEQETERHRAELEQETERHRAELEQETGRHRDEVHKEKQLIEDAERKYQDDVIPLRQKNEELTKMVERLEELKQALTSDVDQTGVMDEGEQLSVEAGEKTTMVDGCVLSTSSECDTTQLVLLPCLGVLLPLH